MNFVNNFCNPLPETYRSLAPLSLRPLQKRRHNATIAKIDPQITPSREINGAKLEI